MLIITHPPVNVQPFCGGSCFLKIHKKIYRKSFPHAKAQSHPRAFLHSGVCYFTYILSGASKPSTPMHASRTLLVRQRSEIQDAFCAAFSSLKNLRFMVETIERIRKVINIGTDLVRRRLFESILHYAVEAAQLQHSAFSLSFAAASMLPSAALPPAAWYLFRIDLIRTIV